MEAKELVKLFDKNGNPKPGSELQSLNLTEIKQVCQSKGCESYVY